MPIGVLSSYQFHLLCKGMKKCGVIQVHNGPYMEKVAKQHIFRG